MKKLTELLHCTTELIRKKFLNVQKDDISHGSADLPIVDRIVEEEDQKDTDEYLNNYNSITRWQTV